MADFKLSAQLSGHDSDVKAVSFPNPQTVLSASRDGSVRVWRQTSDSPPAFEASIASQTSEFVNSVTYLPPSKDHPNGLIASGGKDTIVEIKQPQAAPTDNAERLLVGHSQNVCSLDASPKGSYVVSGGWDAQAIVWNTATWEPEVRLGGHDKSVWAVLAYDEETVLTGCADTNIRIYNLRTAVAGDAEPQSTISTSEVVRALAKLPKGHPSGADIASASNDGIIRLWKLNGQQVGELIGHENFIYALATLPSGELVSSGEDRTVRIWKGNECVQTITHPAISVWTVAANQETGDIVTGASDGIARVFTRSTERTAAAEAVSAFEESVKASAIPQQQLPDINKEKLPGPEFLQSRSGTKEGQVQMINEGNGLITAHQWSQSQQQWVNIGTVVDSAGSSGKKTEYNGKSYDFVFDVDIEDGKPPLKLPYNLSQNPYDAATKFLNDNELPLSYLDNVASFITQNTQGATLGQSAPAAGADPYGTESRYRPGESESAAPRLLPHTEYLFITAGKYDAMVNKILTINANMISAGRKDTALNPAEQNTLKAVKEAIESSKPVSQEGIDLAVKIVSHWPYSERLAGLDLLRCVAPAPLAAELAAPGASFLKIASISALEATDGAEPNENSAMMGLRTFANIFSSPKGRALAAKEAGLAATVLERVLGIAGGAPIGQFNRNVLIAATTTLINYAVLATKERTAPESKRFIAALGKILSAQTDPEVVYRALVALGTYVSSNKAEVKSLGGEGWIKTVIDKVSEARVKNVGQEALRLL
ncbi:Ubiquitin homeostasis protein lub1 [Colletotrichum tanaceti]|uniref:Ubiquitin homeostasis protein lub1 n=1 Tax=Colletotrichum tanaceti TaxID=1306861 RepID=A0A4U6XMK2_9PEZI|nr:Ubiquitin homeostasis protein lub1 [Colletotrichum tanaceti]TKW56892.1 Ubiquitin homeostasis protein lub1 [Colletotrichum tanaceti]